MVFIVILYGLYKKVDIYNAFIEGAKESFPMIMTMFPCMLAMIFGINIFIKSGCLSFLLSFMNPILNMLNLPIEVLSLAILRPISSSSSLAILNSIFSTYGVDSFIGKMCSIIQGSTDTTFYILTLYFGSVGIKKIRYSLYAGLLADLAAIICSILITYLFF
jgi:spore maturation protein B